VIWLGVREQRRWLQVGGLLVFAMATLQLLELLLESPGAGYVVISNSRAACGLFIVALTYVLAWTYRSAPGVPVGAAPFVVAANLLTLFILTSEINAYWHVQALVADEVDLLGRQLMLSVTWALYATVLITVGLRRSYAPIRYLAIAIFAVTIVKVFLFDLAELDQIYRVLSVIALGALLLLTSYLYNKRARRHSG
jgi:uncharacterized membrane protein